MEKYWILPIRTDDLETGELFRRVRFEANNVVRILTKDNRDILYKLESNKTVAQYLSEVKVDGVSVAKWGHDLEGGEQKGKFETMMCRNSLLNS